jgi:hypothetical protein
MAIYLKPAKPLIVKDLQGILGGYRKCDFRPE